MLQRLGIGNVLIHRHLGAVNREQSRALLPNVRRRFVRHPLHEEKVADFHAQRHMVLVKNDASGSLIVLLGDFDAFWKRLAVFRNAPALGDDCQAVEVHGAGVYDIALSGVFACAGTERRCQPAFDGQIFRQREIGVRWLALPFAANRRFGVAIA